MLPFCLLLLLLTVCLSAKLLTPHCPQSPTYDFRTPAELAMSGPEQGSEPVVSST